MRYLTTTLLQIVHSACVPVKNFEKWLIFGEDMKNDKVGRF